MYVGAYQVAYNFVFFVYSLLIYTCKTTGLGWRNVQTGNGHHHR